MVNVIDTSTNCGEFIEYIDENGNKYDEVVIITKKEAEALVKFLSTQWLDRNIEELSNAMHRLQASIKD